MLDGALVDGMICGSVNRYLLADILAAELEMDPVSKAPEFRPPDDVKQQFRGIEKAKKDR
jgi:hypothetical protein